MSDAVRPEVIADMATLPENWNGYGEKPITGPALEVLRNLSIVPLSSGGIQIEWHCNGWDVEIEVGPDGTPVGLSAERWQR